MDNEKIYRQQVIDQYRKEVDSLFRYIPWFQQKRGEIVSKVYQDEMLSEHSVRFPVYDSTLLAFVKEIQRTSLLDRNYPYVYSKNNIQDSADELYAIQHADIKNISVITGILSKYVLGGMTKGGLWTQGVENGVFLESFLKLKELLEVWDKPLA